MLGHDCHSIVAGEGYANQFMIMDILIYIQMNLRLNNNNKSQFMENKYEKKMLIILGIIVSIIFYYEQSYDFI